MKIGICCCCKVGAVVDKWSNATLVRSDDGLASISPYPRQDTDEWNSENPGSPCSGKPPGYCGDWLKGGDVNGLSEQQITDTVNDILACAGTDSTHITKDHNCYTKAGSTDMRMNKKFGFQSALAQKFWHGALPAIWQDDPNIYTAVIFDPGQAYAAGPPVVEHVGFNGYTTTYNTTPPQTRYLSRELVITAYTGILDPTGLIHSTLLTSLDAKTVVGRTTGIKTKTCAKHADLLASGWTESTDCSPWVYGFMNGLTRNNATAHFAAWDTTMVNGPYYIYANTDKTVFSQSGNTFRYTGQRFTDPGFDDVHLLIETTLNISSTGAASYTRTWWDKNIHTLDWFVAGVETLDMTATGDTYTLLVTAYDTVGYFTSNDITATTTLDVAYTSADCYGDWKAAMAAWNLTDFNLAKLRIDEELANAPLILYDEIGPSQPNFTLAADPVAPATDTTLTMDDYSQPQVAGVWQQTAWIDANSFVWVYGTSTDIANKQWSFNQPGGFTGAAPAIGVVGAQMITGMRTGDIIAHTQIGSDKHFWFGYKKMKRHHVTLPATWVLIEHGALNLDENPNLPGVTMRWMDRLQSQYDAQLATPNIGNFPHAFLRQSGGVLIGAKFVCATQQWKSVNFGRPCGSEKYAIDQRSVCCITGGDAAGGFEVATTGEAENPGTGAGNGLRANDYIAARPGTADDGIYKISSITGSSTPWTINVGSKIDDLPTGFDMSSGWGVNMTGTIGRLRFPSVSGVCGRAPITTSYAAGVLTIHSAGGLPFLRKDPATGAIHSVILYDASMSVLSGSLTLARTDDNTFTVTTANHPTAVWLVDSAVTWTDYDSSSKRTGVHLVWTFDQRAASPPTYAGVSGCVGITKTQFTYSADCQAMVGCVPHQPSTTETLYSGGNFAMPSSFTFDDVYGAFWQAATMLTMPDPFWQRPFKPDCGEAPFSWMEDDGAGESNDTAGTTQTDDKPLPLETGTSNPDRYFAHHPLAEALKDIPGGKSLPSGISLFYAADIAPPFYPNGIPLGGADGEFASVETDWGFTLRACGNIVSSGTFSALYAKFVTC